MASKRVWKVEMRSHGCAGWIRISTGHDETAAKEKAERQALAARTVGLAVEVRASVDLDRSR